MHRERGVSLVEALVALAVMAFGMLAIVGIQSSMRLNSDIAKQRSEAVRIAQEALEQARNYSVLDATPGRTAFADIQNQPDTEVAGYTTNTTFKISRVVVDLPAQHQKVLRVRVTWYDRASDAQRGDAPQSVLLQSVINRADPALAALLVTAPAGSPNLRPRSRHAAIPWQSRDMGDGSSAFKPPAPGGGETVWIFNNVTGYITGVCTVAAGTTTADLNIADIADCRDNTLAQLLSGYVRFSTGLVQPTAAEAENPGSNAFNLVMALTLTSVGHPAAPSCFDDSPTTAVASALQFAVAYYCAIPANGSRSWSGYLTVAPRAFVDFADSVWSIQAIGDVPATHRLCRYTPASNDAVVVPNWHHPRLYRVEYADAPRNLLPLAMPPLVNQNFLVVRSEFDCPADVAADPGAGDFVNSNTLWHQPWP
jgi:Tfp pilus assembly protein PilV